MYTLSAALPKLKPVHFWFSSFCACRSFSFEERGSTSSFGDVANLRSGSLTWQKANHLEKHNEGKSSENSTGGHTKPPIGGHLVTTKGQTVRDSCRPPVSNKPFRSLHQEDVSAQSVRRSAVLQQRPYRSCDISFGRSGSHLNASDKPPEKADKTLAPSKPTSNVRTVMKIFEKCPQLHAPSPEKSSPCLPRRAASFKETRYSATAEGVRTNQWKQPTSGKEENFAVVPGQPPPQLLRHRSWDALIRSRPDVGPCSAATATAKPVKSRSVTTDIASIISTPCTASTQNVSSSLHQVSLQTPVQGPRPQFQQHTNTHSSAMQQHTTGAADKPTKPTGKLATAQVEMSVKFPKPIDNRVLLTSKAALRTTSKSEEDLTKHRPFASHRLSSPVALQTSVATPMSEAKSSPQQSSAPAKNSSVFNTWSTKQNSHSQCIGKESRPALDTLNIKAQKQVFSTSSYMPPLLSTRPSFPQVTSSSHVTESSPATKMSTLQLGALAVVSPATTSTSKSDIVSRSIATSVPTAMPTPNPESTTPAASKVSLLHTSTAKTTTGSAVLSTSSVMSRSTPFLSRVAQNPSPTTTISSSVSSMTSPPPAASSSSALSRTQGITTKAPVITSAPCNNASMFRSKTVLTLSNTTPRETEKKRSASAENNDVKRFDDREKGGMISHASYSGAEALAFPDKPSQNSPKDSKKEQQKQTAVSLQSNVQTSSDQSVLPPIRSLEKSDSQSRNEAKLDYKDRYQAVDSVVPARIQTPTKFEKGLDRLTKAAVKYIPSAPQLQRSGIKTACLHSRDDTQPTAETKVIPKQIAIHVSTSAIAKDPASKNPDDPVLPATSTKSPNSNTKDQKHTKTEDDRNLCKDDTSDFTDSISSNKLLPLPKYSVIKRNRLRQQHRNRRSIHNSSSCSSSSSNEDESNGTEWKTRRNKHPRRKFKSATNSASDTSRP